MTGIIIWSGYDSDAEMIKHFRGGDKMLGKGVVIESPEDMGGEFRGWMRAVMSRYENE